MYGTSLLAFGLLLGSAIAVPAFTGKPFQITHLSIQEIEGANTTLKFTVHDPDPLTNATQKCTGAWKTGSDGYPQGSYKSCSANSTFACKYIERHNKISGATIGSDLRA
jgi:hypothetical protein